MGQKHIDLHVPTSDDGRTTFSEVADVLDHLATLYAWHHDVYGFLVTRAHEARQIDMVYEHLDMNEVYAHWQEYPQGCPVRTCDVCRARRK